ncbi:MAG: PepSY domain-containing protein [Hyphomicrobiaceae bacterium]
MTIVLLSGQPASAADRTCFASWSEAAPVVRREGLTTVRDLSRMTRSRTNADIVNSTLCRSDGRYIYRLVIRQRSGPLRSMEVDARHPFADPGNKK